MDTPSKFTSRLIVARKIAGLLLGALWHLAAWAIWRSLYRVGVIILIVGLRLKFWSRVAWFFGLGIARKFTRNTLDALWRVKIREHKAATARVLPAAPALPKWSEN